MADCCRLVGNFDIADQCIISVSMNSSTESNKGACDEIIVGPTIGTVSISAYATEGIHIGCPGKASISIPWVRRYDCDRNEVYFIFAGAGKASVAGDVQGLATISQSIGRNYNTVSASASSGPATIYFYDEQEDGYGLTYTGGPYSFNANTEDGVEFNRIISNIGPETWYLQSFSLDCQPGQVPTASYSFVFQMTS